MMTVLCVATGFAATETFDFHFSVMGETGWSSQYQSHTVDGSIATVTFASANKQTSTITDIPVTKGGNVTAVLNDMSTYKITGVKLVCRQWTTKAQTITLNTSDDGSSFTATSTTSSNFTLTALGLDTKAVRFTFSSTSNQVGIESLEITYSEVGSEELAAPTILLNGVAPKAEYSTEELPLTLTIASNNGTESPKLVYSFMSDPEQVQSGIVSSATINLGDSPALNAVVGSNTLYVQEVIGSGETAQESLWASATFTIKEPVVPLTSLADVNALAKDAEFTYGAETVVMGKYNKNMYIVMPDNTAGALIYDANNNWPDGYTFGQVIKDGWSGKMAVYNTKPEVINPVGFELKGETTEVTPDEITADDLTKANFGRYAVLKNMTVAAGGTMTGIPTYDQFKTMTGVTAGTYDVYGVIGWNNDAGQFMPLRYEAVVDPTVILAPSIVIAPENIEEGDDYTITITNLSYSETVARTIQVRILDANNETLYQGGSNGEVCTLSTTTHEGLPTEAGTYTVRARVTDGEQSSEYTYLSYTIKEPAVPLTSLADVNALAKDAEFTYGAETVVMGKYNKNMYIVMPDNTAGALIYDANNNWPDGYTFGQVIKDGWSGKMAVYNTKPEVINPVGFELKGETTEVTPDEITADDLTKANFGRYAVLKNMTVAAGGTMTGIPTYDQFKTMTGVTAGTYDVYGVIGWNNDAGQFMPLRYEAVVDSTVILAPSIVIAPENIEEGDDYTITITNLSYSETVAHTIQVTIVDANEVSKFEGYYNGEVYTLPSTNELYHLPKVAGTYTVLACVTDGEHSSEYTVLSYTITEPVEPLPAAGTATIVFDDYETDSNAEVTSDVVLAYITEGATYVASASGISKVYKGITGLKFSSSSVNGAITLNFTQAFPNVKKVEVNAKAWANATTGKVDAAKLNDVELAEELADYTIIDATEEPIEELASLTLTATKRAYLKSITITWGEETPEPVKNVMNYTAPENCEMSVALADGTPVVSGETEIEEGTQVVMTIIPAEGFEVKSVQVTEVAADVTGAGAPRRAAGDQVEVTSGEAENTYVFNMPANGVDVTVEIGETSPTTGIDEINVAGNGAVKYVNAMGQVSDRPFKGINIKIEGGKATKVIK